MRLTTAFIDAENVRRSLWPNLTADELVTRCRVWAASEGVRAVVVFDGQAPGGVLGERRLDAGCTLVGTGNGSADDWIATAVADAPGCWLVTSDRELRVRAAAAAARVIGGGTFARTLVA